VQHIDFVYSSKPVTCDLIMAAGSLAPSEQLDHCFRSSCPRHLAHARRSFVCVAQLHSAHAYAFRRDGIDRYGCKSIVLPCSFSVPEREEDEQGCVSSRGRLPFRKALTRPSATPAPAAAGNGGRRRSRSVHAPLPVPCARFTAKLCHDCRNVLKLRSQKMENATKRGGVYSRYATGAARGKEKGAEKPKKESESKGRPACSPFVAWPYIPL
jgi:hypothetical protein